MTNNKTTRLTAGSFVVMGNKRDVSSRPNVFGILTSMFEREEVWQRYDAWGMGPRMLLPREFYEEMGRPASRFKQPLSLYERMQFSLQRFFAEHSITKDLPMYVQSGVPLNWQIILNYLYREGILESTTPIVGNFRNDKPKIPYLGLKPHYDATVTDAVERVFLGHGSAPTFDETLSKAVGELLERYMGTYYKKESFLRASVREMKASGRDFLSLEQCSKFLPWQQERFSELSSSEETSFRWIETQELPSGKKVFIPTQLTLWLYNRSLEHEPLLSPMTSSGMAGGFTRTEAVVSAIREYVERDGFLVYWMNTLSPQCIDTSDADEEIKQLEGHLAKFNIKAYFLSTTTDVTVPSVTCVLIYDEGGESIISLGACAGETATKTLLGAYGEAVLGQSLAVDRQKDIDLSFDEYKPFTRSDININTRTYIWQGREMYDKVKFFLSGEKITFNTFAALFPAYKSSQEELDALVRKISSLGDGYEIYVSDKKHDVLDALGYHVAKVFIPKLVPLHLNEHFAPLAATRLGEVVEKLGRGKATLNIYPHPFP